MDTATLESRIAAQWDAEIVPQLTEYIRIPAKSPHFDPQWDTNGHIELVVRQAEAWVRAQPVDGLAVEIVRLPGRTPVLYFEVQARGTKHGRTVLLYGHLDKQPEMTGWRDDLGPWTPGTRTASCTAAAAPTTATRCSPRSPHIGALQAQGLPHARCVGLIETCEESGSYDLPAYLDHLAPRIGERGLRRRPRFGLRRLRAAVGDDVAAWPRGGHARRRRADRRRALRRRERRSCRRRFASPASFSTASRTRDSGRDPAAPTSTRRSRTSASSRRGRPPTSSATSSCASTHSRERTAPMASDRAEALLNRTLAAGAVGHRRRRLAADRERRQRAAAEDGAQALAAPAADGRPGETATAALRHLLEADPPYGASVSFEPDQGATGWNAPATAPWLAAALESASRAFYGRPAGAMGEGGTIPFMGMLGAQVPAGAVPDHRRAGPRVERARSERVPARPLREEAHRVRGVGARRARVTTLIRTVGRHRGATAKDRNGVGKVDAVVNDDKGGDDVRVSF